MTTWIGHLRIAERLYQAFPQLDKTAFILGNLAPDSGIPNEDWSVFDPPKEVTHFIREGKEEDGIRDLLFYRTYLMFAEKDDSAAYSYRIGYFFHLICDNLWARRVWATAKQEAQVLYEALGSKAIWTLKRDWYGLDFKYVRDHPDSAFWRVLVPAPNPPQYLPFLPLAGVHHSLDYIRQWYSSLDAEQELDRRYPYLSEQTMSRFVDDAVTDIADIYRTINHNTQLDTYPSALSLLPEASLAPYPSPLGEHSSVSP